MTYKKGRERVLGSNPLLYYNKVFNCRKNEIICKADLVKIPFRNLVSEIQHFISF